MAEEIDIARKRQRDNEKRMELTEHLAELRNRILRVVLYVIISATACYFFFKPIYRFLLFPMSTLINAHKDEGWKLVFTHFTEPFFVVLKISLIAGLVFMSPFVVFELWGFIAPALTKAERKPLYYVAPMAVVLFFAGVSLAYWVARFAITWFVSYVSWFPQATLLQDPETYVIFILKMMGVFGLVFQLPIVLMFLAWIGLLKSEPMKRSWRYAVVGISLVGVFVTPSNDAFTMLMMIIPVIFLYLGSIWLVRIIERRREARMSV